MSLPVTSLYLVRHGETDWNAEERLQGTIDVGLNARGGAQAEQIARFFAGKHLDAIYTSDLHRASATARAISGVTGAAVREWALLRERRFGLWEGLTSAELAAEMKVTAPGQEARVSLAETRSEQAERAGLLLAFVREGWRGCTIAAVSHGGFIKQCLLAVLGLGSEHRRGMAVDTGSVFLVEHSGLGWRPVSLNHVPS